MQRARLEHLGEADVQRAAVVFFSSRGGHTRYWRDWSSDVCSSDLRYASERGTSPPSRDGRMTGPVVGRFGTPAGLAVGRLQGHVPAACTAPAEGRHWRSSQIVKIGRASCRERVKISVVAVSLKKRR